MPTARSSRGSALDRSPWRRDGTPADIIEQLHEFDHVMGGVDQASMQVNFNDMPYADAEQSVRLFGEKVIPHFAAELATRGGCTMVLLRPPSPATLKTPNFSHI